ncbi:hypothetical protein C5167_015232 [Papaver somniferum]|uniref:Uncharacterized protein n=1 Tax=Papaver somniferum TaxID=3469 RepID=A0A4Y7J6C5_PAPSO|nr:hypothetical protein C5167_015232 [Papaver somniferum]
MKECCEFQAVVQAKKCSEVVQYTAIERMESDIKRRKLTAATHNPNFSELLLAENHQFLPSSTFSYHLHSSLPQHHLIPPTRNLSFSELFLAEQPPYHPPVLHPHYHLHTAISLIIHSISIPPVPPAYHRQSLLQFSSIFHSLQQPPPVRNNSNAHQQQYNSTTSTVPVHTPPPYHPVHNTIPPPVAKHLD